VGGGVRALFAPAPRVAPRLGRPAPDGADRSTHTPRALSRGQVRGRVGGGRERL